MTIKEDRDIIRGLASRIAELAALPHQEETRTRWRNLNGLRPERPMVMIDQICWHELNGNHELSLECQDAGCRAYETELRQVLYRWKHFRVDMVIEPFIRVPMAISNTGFGLNVHEEVAVSDPANSVVSHKFENQFTDDGDLDKIQMPAVHHNIAETRRRLDVAHQLFDGLLEVKPCGYDPYLSLWDPIAFWMGVEGALYAMIDRPEFMHRMVARMTEGYLGLLDQLETQGLLCGPQELIHCTGAYTDELPAPGYDPQRPRTRDLWMFGLAQMFSTVSPEMFKEFEIDYTARICERFGLVYYGCCDPLDGKMKEVRMLPHVRKISMSPWADEQRGAAEIGRDYVFSRKPNPAHVAMTSFNEELIRKDLQTTRLHCQENGCALEYILKDISTVNYDPTRLSRWADIAMSVAEHG